jgi:cytochrome c-type biogenesis protein CcmF
LIYEAMTDGKKISVGPPYFNAVFVPLMLLLFAAMAVSPTSRWKKTPLIFFTQQWKPVLASLLIVGALVWFLGSSFSGVVVLVDAVALWIVINLARDWWSKVANKAQKLPSLLRQTMSYYGMLLGHLGIAVALIGVCTTVYYTEEKDLRMAPGDVVSLAGYEFRFNEMRKVQGPNYVADQAEIEVLKDGVRQTLLFPEKRFYEAARNMMTEADIDPTLFRDLYVALGEPIDGTAWAVRVHYKPFVRWIWFGGLLIALGGFTTVLDRRYRAVKQARQASLTAGVTV